MSGMPGAKVFTGLLEEIGLRLLGLRIGLYRLGHLEVGCTGWNGSG